MNRSDQAIIRTELNNSARAKDIGSMLLETRFKVRSIVIKAPGEITARLTVELQEYCL